MATYFTGCTHFGHAKIILHCDRPFSSLDEMDAALIEAWNARVGKGDDVWHLGDFGLARSVAQGQRMAEIFSRLNGRKRLILGNHDHKFVRRLPWAAPPERMAEVSVDGTDLVLCHYPMASWNKMRHGVRHLYSHVHASMLGNSLSVDVGVDGWGFSPVTVEEALRAMARLPAVTFGEDATRHDFRALADEPDPEPSGPSP